MRAAPDVGSLAAMPRATILEETILEEQTT